MTPPITGKERRKAIEYVRQGKITGLLEAIILTMKDTATLLIQRIEQPANPEMKERQQALERKSDALTSILLDQVLKGVFLSISHFDLKLVHDRIDAIIDGYQRIGHRTELIPLQEWIEKHLITMLTYSASQLEALLSMLSDPEEIPDQLIRISEIENEADKSHSDFLKKLYSLDIGFKRHTQAEFLDLTIENIIDDLERLGKSLKVILREIKITSEDLPPYLK